MTDDEPVDPPHNPGPSFVRVEDCRERHENAKAELTLIKTALFGVDGRGGIVKDISEIKVGMKHRWTVKDAATLVMAIAALLAALYQYLA